MLRTENPSEMHTAHIYAEADAHIRKTLDKNPYFVCFSKHHAERQTCLFSFDFCISWPYFFEEKDVSANVIDVSSSRSVNRFMVCMMMVRHYIIIIVGCYQHKTKTKPNLMQRRSVSSARHWWKQNSFISTQLK